MNLQLNNKIGTFPDFEISRLAESGFISNFDANCVNPSSYDLRINGDIYELPHSFQVSRGQTILQTMKDIGYTRISVCSPLLEDKYYVVFIEEDVDLPKDIYGYANPKSTIGRLDLHTRLLADRVCQYDTLSKGFSGKLAGLVTPKSFPVLLHEDTPLNQMRFFNGDARLSGFALESFMQREKPLYVPDGEQKSALRFKESNRSDERSLLLTVGTDYEIPGYVARKGINFDPIDISKKKHYKWADYFDIVQREKDGSLVLEKGRFYILATYEHVLIPPLFAAEIASINDRLGEFRSHYAGFIDNGFGYGKEGELKGAPIVLEVRPFETMRITNKQPVARLKFEPTIARPIKIYGEDGVGSNYADQIGPRLAKQFRM